MPETPPPPPKKKKYFEEESISSNICCKRNSHYDILKIYFYNFICRIYGSLNAYWSADWDRQLLLVERTCMTAGRSGLLYKSGGFPSQNIRAVVKSPPPLPLCPPPHFDPPPPPFHLIRLTSEAGVIKNGFSAALKLEKRFSAGE